MLAVGKNGWTLPIPIVHEVEGWYFDAEAGRELRIGHVGVRSRPAVVAGVG
jgi:hypothetical protein